MALWIRLPESYANDPAIWRLSEGIQRSYPAALGHLTMLSLHVARWCPDGGIGAFPNAALERWAAWDGEPSLFATTLRDTLLLADGSLAGWSDRMGKLIEWQSKNTESQRKRRLSSGQSRGQSPGNCVYVSSKEDLNANGKSSGQSSGQNGVPKVGTPEYEAYVDRRANELLQQRMKPS